MKTWYIDIFKWPAYYEIEAETEEEAKEEAIKQFKKRNHDSIYEVVVK